MFWTHIKAICELSKLYIKRIVNIQLEGSLLGLSAPSVIFGILERPETQVTKENSEIEERLIISLVNRIHSESQNSKVPKKSSKLQRISILMPGVGQLPPFQ